jgi:hypothetical protein
MYEKQLQFYNMPFTRELSVPDDFFIAFQSHCDNDPGSSFERETNVDDGVGLIF